MRNSRVKSGQDGTIRFEAYGTLGAITGLVSALFIRSIYGFQSFFENRVKAGYYVQHAAGMLVAGIILVSKSSGDLFASSVQGIVTRRHILDVLADDMELFGD